MADKVVWYSSGVCCLILLIPSIILFSVSWDVVLPREYAIVYDNTHKTIDKDDVRESGRYLVGLGRKFITFPRGVVTLEFKNLATSDAPQLECWTANGQNVLIDFSLQISLVKEKLPKLYEEWQSEWRAHLVLWIQQVVKDTTTTFSTLSFFSDREEIASSLNNNIRDALKEDGFFKLEYMQLREIDVPELFETAILDKMLQLQIQRKELYNREAQRFRQEIQNITASAVAFADLVLARATAEGEYNVTLRAAVGKRLLVEERALKYKEMSDALEWTAEDNWLLLAQYYQWLTVLRNSGSKSRKFVGLDSGGILNVG